MSRYYITKSIEKNIVLSGLSAGSICWFTFGNSDSRKFIGNKNHLIKVSGLWFINALHCPHYDTEPHRQEDLKRMMKNCPLVAIALENNCAIQIKNENYRIITSNSNAKAYKIYWKDWEYCKKEIYKSNVFVPLGNLLKK